MPAATTARNATHAASDARSPRRRGGEQTAERVLDAAEALFAERGYAGTALRDIAQRADLRTPSLYNHFEGKEALYAAVLERGIGPVLAILAGLAEEPGAARPDSDEVVGRVMALLERHPNLPRLILQETLSGGAHLTPMLRQWIAPTFARAGDLLAASPAAARWGEERIPLLVLALYHVVVGYFTIAPLYGDLAGEDLLAADAIQRQTDFLRQLVATLVTDEADAVAAPSRGRRGR